jgi:CheY-like chemotaxis protein
MLLAAGARVDVVLSAEAARASVASGNPLGLLLLDASLPGMPIGQLLAAAQAEGDGPRFPIVLVADAVTQEWIDRLADGAVDDLILRSAELA